MTKDLTTGRPARLILLFTLPLIAGNIFQQLYGFVDTLIVGRILGVDALAAVGCTGALLFFIMGFGMGSTSGFSIYTGQRFGAGDMDGVRQSFAACMVMTLLTSLAMTAVSVPLCRWVLTIMQTPPEIIDGAHSFISIIFACLFVPFSFMMLTNIIRALGDSRTPTIMLALSLASNIVLEPLFIMGFGWGIPGAAWSVVVAQAFGAILAFAYIWRKLPLLHVKKSDWHMSWRFLYEHMRIGLPMGFQSSIIAIGAVILQIALNNLGPVAVASYAASQRVDAIATMPMMSFGMTMAAYTAQNYGARKFRRIGDGVRQCIYMSVGFSIVAGLFNALMGPELIWLFVGDANQQVIEYGHIYLVIQGASYWILSLLFIFRFTLQGLGQSIVPTIAGIMELFMRAIAALVLVAYFGYVGACFASPMAWLGSCVPLAIAYLYTRKSIYKRFRRELQ